MSDLSKISFGGTEYNVKDTTARAESAKKVTAAGGDISNTKIATADSITTAYPIPAAGDTAKGFLGKMKKFCEDIRNTTTGACFIGQIVNNCVTNNAKLPLSAAQGKVLMDLVTQLNADMTNNASAVILPDVLNLSYTSNRWYGASRAAGTINLPGGVNYAYCRMLRFSEGAAYLSVIDAESKRQYVKMWNDVAGWGDYSELVLKDDLGKAKYVSDLMGAQGVPTLVQWTSDTLNTPYKAGKTTSSHGFAIVYGGYSDNQVIFAMALGTTDFFIHRCSNGTPSGWETK